MLEDVWLKRLTFIWCNQIMSSSVSQFSQGHEQSSIYFSWFLYKIEKVASFEHPQVQQCFTYDFWAIWYTGVFFCPKVIFRINLKPRSTTWIFRLENFLRTPFGKKNTVKFNRDNPPPSNLKIPLKQVGAVCDDHFQYFSKFKTLPYFVPFFRKIHWLNLIF